MLVNVVYLLRGERSLRGERFGKFYLKIDTGVAGGTPRRRVDPREKVAAIINNADAVN
jgi:hypothetical protein